MCKTDELEQVLERKGRVAYRQQTCHSSIRRGYPITILFSRALNSERAFCLSRDDEALALAGN